MAHLINLHRLNCSWDNPKRIGYRTHAWRNADGFSIRLHSTNVVSYDAATKILFVSTGGWFSKITAERIRHGLAELGLQLLTRDLPNRWRVADYHGNAWTIRGNSIKLKLAPNADSSWQRVE